MTAIRVRSGRPQSWGASPARPWLEGLSAAIGVAALAAAIAVAMVGGEARDEHGASVDAAGAASASSSTVGGGASTVIGGYGGTTYTYPSEVRITKPGAIDMSVRDFGWIGLPFKSPIYYGVRVQRWGASGTVGSMIDFTHAKAIANANDVASMSGTRDGATVPAKARVGDVFKHLEFSHGHNMLTLNGLFRWPALGAKIRPYAGIGGGISLPHTEIGFRSAENKRTYEYQLAGLVGQVLAGIEIDLGRSALFIEYKFSYAPYDVPLSEEPRGDLLFTDLWRQFRAWTSGNPPPGGRLATTLATHHGIGGMLLRLGQPSAATAR